MLKIIEHIEGVRKAKGMTRKEMAEKMEHGFTKESLDKVFSGDHCPGAHSIALMCETLGLPTYPSEWFLNDKSDEK